MKQYITVEQFDELTDAQKIKIMKKWSKKVGDLIFCRSESNDRVFFGVITDLNGGKAYASWDTQGSTASVKQIINSVWCPLFSYGHLLEFYLELFNQNFEYDFAIPYKTIDELWELIKEDL